ncbi:SixA phosphatase family protein [Coralloluteibacterium thermophilus]|uniref:SixA phosphatase family protein n=1 Tax=Coralloluteibacterium thermophilum TaxID=2707049 RepID=A0ABV9NGG4_9GAMM
MTELILLRHAHADAAAPGQSDLDRSLSAEGEAEAEAAAQWLREQGFSPDRVLCSPAQRTRATCERVMRALGYADLRDSPQIYEATPGTLLDLVDAHRDVPRLMLVGHNPGLERLLALLTSGRSGDARGMPPASIAWLRFDGGQPLEPGAAELVRFWFP